MKQALKSRSGKRFFFVALLVIVAGILATALLANDKRNLTLLFAYFGYDAPFAKPATPPVEKTSLTIVKGVRLPAAQVALPAYAFADMGAPVQDFIRVIQSDPRSLCETLKAGGFAGLDWIVSAANPRNWECSSTVDLPAGSGSDQSNGPRSSIFIFIKSEEENRVTSFRVKMNIERPEDRPGVTALAANAASIFLKQVRWDNGEEIIAKVKALEEFDIRNFGSRIQLKKEFGETPRYNFLANQLAVPGKKTISNGYFDRAKWLQLTDENGLPMIEGMMAGEAAGKGGLALPQPDRPAASER